ncbi:MAG: bifunctional precorrin-2 dehydrogenase/sirohydrochlorin ferrochelatase [Ktedonobacteraceae bacterium]|nr:bifunctional precorrin-2 dehydrogenase/sirohydrochlorin ferrochelatase [Ktedonobacteraceae bacterium]
MDKRPKSEDVMHPPSATENRLYPAFLTLEGKVCVVVGGGHVATRKVRSLLAAGAHVVVISEVLHADLQMLHADNVIDVIPENYAREHLMAASLVFAATNDHEVNHQIAQDAHERGMWVNVADNPDGSDFYVPATIRRQGLTLAISTGGGSPAFARYVRELLEQSLSDALGQALEMVMEARPLILAETKERQAQLWNGLLALHLERVIEIQGYEGAHRLFGQWLEQHMTEKGRIIHE